MTSRGPRSAMVAAAVLVALVVSACGAGGVRANAIAATSPSAASATATATATPTGTPPTVIVVEGSASASATPAPAVRLATPAVAPTTPPTSVPNPVPRVVTLSGHGVPVVVLDPGHGGEEIGAAAYGVVERDSNLDMAQRTAKYLKAAGVDVVLTRETEDRAAGPASGAFNATRADLQARVSLANQVKGAVFVSLHSNGSGDPSARGVEVYWESRRPWANENLRLAQSLLNGVVDSLAAAGYPTRNRGTIDAACWRNNNGRCVGLFVLSPEGGPVTTPQGGTQTTTSKEATNMPAALVESLFISNVEDASLLRSDGARDAIAHGLSNAILRYLGRPT